MAKAKVKPKAKAKPKANAKAKPKAKKPAAPAMSIGHAALLPVLRSIRSVIYKVDDLAKAKAFYASALARQPYFDEPFYAGFEVDGQELGLDPDISTLKPGPGGAVAYWKVSDIHAVWNRLTTELGGRPIELPHNVGGEIETAIVADPFGNLVGLIQIDS
jgi:predicted enzyme related to lactoylglutathione lyase